ncbi:MAG: hypothetical protein JWN30_1036 [Bacilli bacterium]|nr:hypothetical protein [Bacilli bacterium]
MEIADKLVDLVDKAERYLAESSSEILDPHDSLFRRLAIDVQIMTGIGQFFSQKFRAGLAFALFERTGEPNLLKETVGVLPFGSRLLETDYCRLPRYL